MSEENGNLEAADLGIAPQVDLHSPKARLQARRRAAGDAVTKDLDVFGYGGDLVARYRLLDPQVEGKSIGERIMKNYASPADQNWFGALDTLIAACVGFYYRDPETDKLTLLDEDGNGPMGYDARLANYLNLQGGSARETVVEVFDGKKIALLAHVRELNEWMEHPTSAATLGEA